MIDGIAHEHHERSSRPGFIAGRQEEGDRRKSPTGPLDAFRFAGRRKTVRRKSERTGPYFVDQFDATTLAMIVSVLMLSLVDGILTIELLDLNSEEANPLMRLLLDHGHRPFLVGKFLLTAMGLPFVVVFKNWPMFGSRFRVGYVLPVFLGLYLVLLAYQLHLLAC